MNPESVIITDLSDKDYKEFIQRIKRLLKTSPFVIEYHLLHDGKMERGIKREFDTIEEI